MTRVLLVSAAAVPGGARGALANIVGGLPGLGLEPQAAMLQDGSLEEWLRRAGWVVAVLATGCARHLVRTARVVSRLRGIALREWARVVVCNEFRGHLDGGHAVLAARIPAVWWQQGMASPRASGPIS